MVTARSKVTGLSKWTSSMAWRGGARPEGGWVVVDCGCRLRGLDVAGLCDEVVRVDALDRGAELLKALDIGVGDAAGVVGCEAEHQLGSAADGLGVDVEQFVDGVERAFVVGMPEPMFLAQRRVGFDRTPAQVAVRGR